MIFDHEVIFIFKILNEKTVPLPNIIIVLHRQIFASLLCMSFAYINLTYNYDKRSAFCRRSNANLSLNDENEPPGCGWRRDCRKSRDLSPADTAADAADAAATGRW